MRSWPFCFRNVTTNRQVLVVGAHVGAFAIPFAKKARHRGRSRGKSSDMRTAENECIVKCCAAYVDL